MVIYKNYTEMHCQQNIKNYTIKFGVSGDNLAVYMQMSTVLYIEANKALELSRLKVVFWTAQRTLQDEFIWREDKTNEVPYIRT